MTSDANKIYHEAHISILLSLIEENLATIDQALRGIHQLPLGDFTLDLVSDGDGEAKTRLLGKAVFFEGGQLKIEAGCYDPKDGNQASCVVSFGREDHSIGGSLVEWYKNSPQSRTIAFLLGDFDLRETRETTLEALAMSLREAVSFSPEVEELEVSTSSEVHRLISAVMLEMSLNLDSALGELGLEPPKTKSVALSSGDIDSDAAQNGSIKVQLNYQDNKSLEFDVAYKLPSDEDEEYFFIISPCGRHSEIGSAILNWQKGEPIEEHRWSFRSAAGERMSLAEFATLIHAALEIEKKSLSHDEIIQPLPLNDISSLGIDFD